MTEDREQVHAPQPSIERMRRFDVRPRRRLGQNFLIDNNILDVIAENADLRHEDVVLEVGGGLGVLSEHLAARVAYLHVIEVDHSLEPPLKEALAAHQNASLILGDAIDVDFGALRPPPGKLVANLPYNVAASCVIKAFQELPELELCCVMAQREVGERLTAVPGSKLYGATSVLVSSVAADVATRRLSRNIFHPVPNVDSSLVTLRRTAPNPPREFIDLVHDAFAHRRKPLASSLAHARRRDSEIKQRAVGALKELGFVSSTRAEELTAKDFLKLAELLT